MNKKYLHRQTESGLYLLARQNRKLSTEAEEILWRNLRGRKLNGFKFRRQQPMGSFILDFFCLEKNLAVEVDGGYHDEEKQKIYDEHRSVELNALHVTVLRFSNNEVINNLRSVVDTIAIHLIPSPSPSAARQEKGDVGSAAREELGALRVRRREMLRAQREDLSSPSPGSQIQERDLG